jgi:hypothetical protein
LIAVVTGGAAGIEPDSRRLKPLRRLKKGEHIFFPNGPRRIVYRF